MSFPESSADEEVKEAALNPSILLKYENNVRAPFMTDLGVRFTLNYGFWC
jgi:hypothetical protein